MNTLKSGLSLCCLLYLSSAVYSQRPSYVVNAQGEFRQRMYVPLATLDVVFSASRNVTLTLDDSLKVRGMILSKLQPNESTVSVNIEIGDAGQTTLSVSKTKLEGGKFSYTAHLVRAGSGEVWSLEEERGSYYFVSSPRQWLFAD